jgi:hypothetical protein
MGMERNSGTIESINIILSLMERNKKDTATTRINGTTPDAALMRNLFSNLICQCNRLPPTGFLFNKVNPLFVLPFPDYDNKVVHNTI